MLDLLGRPPRAGPYFQAGDKIPAVVLSHDFWHRRFGGDQAIVGQTIVVDGQPQRVTVLGVMPEGFSFPYRSMLGPSGFSRAQHADLWLPLTPAFDQRLVDSSGQPNRNVHYLGVIAQLKSGMTIERASRRTRRHRHRPRGDVSRFERRVAGDRPAASRANRRAAASGALHTSRRRRRRPDDQVPQRRQRPARAGDRAAPGSRSPLGARCVADPADAADARREPAVVSGRGSARDRINGGGHSGDSRDGAGASSEVGRSHGEPSGRRLRARADARHGSHRRPAARALGRAVAAQESLREAQRTTASPARQRGRSAFSLRKSRWR